MTTLEFVLIGIVALLILLVVVLYLMARAMGEIFGSMIKGLIGWRPEDEDRR